MVALFIKPPTKGKNKEKIMILVLLGTQNNSFHRLLEEVEKNIKDKTINEEVIVQDIKHIE